MGNVFGRRYGLIGDSGEKDPEIFSAIARQFLQQIRQVLIRNVQSGQMQDQRLEEVFRVLDSNRWMVFRDAGEIIFGKD